MATALEDLLEQSMGRAHTPSMGFERLSTDRAPQPAGFKITKAPHDFGDQLVGGRHFVSGLAHFENLDNLANVLTMRSE